MKKGLPDPQHPRPLTRSQVLEQIYEQDAYTKEHEKKVTNGTADIFLDALDRVA